MKLSTKIILSLTSLAVLFSGCTKETGTPKQVKIDPTLPTPIINGHLADMNAIAFEWKSIQDPRVLGVYVYRLDTSKKENKLHRIDKIENRYATHYTNVNLQPDTRYDYSFSSYTDDDVESNPSATLRVSTLPVLESVSFFKSIGNMPRSAKLIWRPHTNLKVKEYRIERQTLEDKEWQNIATIHGRLSAEYIDTDLQDNHVYKYRLRAITYDDIVSTPSDIAKVVTKPLPEMIQNVSATTHLAKQIQLKWEPSTNKDFSFYNIYRGSSSTSYTYYVKTRKNNFTDLIKEDGKHYYYYVSAVDKDGLESPKQPLPIQGMTLAKPQMPTLLEGKVIDNSAKLKWQRNDKRAISYIVLKTTKHSWVDKSVEEITDIKQNQFTDMDILPEVAYEYQVIAVDENGLRSLPTEAIEISYKAK